ncbi:multiple monosaccharide ABC transporter ATP-binding protein [Clostridium sp. C2-6-12]|uniref:multiple monosaccharide ABC transporter ATP-binding protein n=1 Tax=Clostridium sp. C2-6-12 TaxID=2698832 RepID=UPI0013689439|nr:multiple monosaccharide ABC transporter ATP-binding protein [Clostridium sp. C2-6-12]
MSDFILEMKDIVKTFGKVKALNGINLKVRKGDIHAICGENGAGKSTLMNVLSGVYPSNTFSGTIEYDGNVCNFSNVKDSEKLGIVIIHQELALIPYLSIAENIFLGNEQATKGVINWDNTTLKAQELLKKVSLNENPNTLISNIGVGKQQLVEIAKALSKDVKLLILDEPTAALNEEDSDRLLELLLDLKKNHGVTSILISHKLNEISKVADQITVIRDGKSIETMTKGVDEITEDRIIKGMVGRDMADRFPPREPKIGDTLFEVSNWTVHDPYNDSKKVIDNVNFNIKKGEIIGFAGLMGAGRTEIAMSLFGKSYGKKISGSVKMNGKELDLSNVSKAIDNGLAYVTEDRKNYGLILMDEILKNTTLANLKGVSKNGIIDKNAENKVAEDFRKKFKIKSSSVLQPVGNLSGGNQQKVVLSKCIFTDPQVLILDEPTRGIDVGAKYEIYTIINELAASGRGVLVISSEMPELLGLCDRIYVVNEGRMVGELSKKEATQESIMKCIMNNKEVCK